MRVGHIVNRAVDMRKLGHVALLERKLRIRLDEPPLQV
jgi:hypothetical protein